MSIARRVIARRLLGTGAASLALCAGTVAAASGAWAQSTPGGDGWKSGGTYRSGTGAGTETADGRCQFSLDGRNFSDSVKVDDQSLKVTGDGKVHVSVRAAAGAATCTASLASYLADGPTFATSGQQVFVDFDTVTVKPGGTGSLDISVPDAGCFAQIDLYRGAVKFDGRTGADDGFEHGALPEGPDRPVIKDKLIAAWNGGTRNCTSEPPAAEEPPATGPAEPSEPAEPGVPSQPAEPSEPARETPPAEGTPAPEPSESAPESAPRPNGGGDNLAETGGSSATGPIALGAAVLVAGGAAFLVAARRRRTSGS